MRLHIMMAGPGGLLEEVVVDEAAAVNAVVTMVRAAGELHPGDTIVVMDATHHDRLASEPAAPDAVERYKGFVIHQDMDGGYTWSRGNIARAPFASVSEVRADIDAFVAAAGQ